MLQPKEKRRAVFIDKDGTLVPDIPYNADPELVTLEQDIIEGIRLLQQESFLLIVISNQQGIAKGYFTPGDLQKIWDKISRLFEENGLLIDAFYYCPHEPGALMKEYDAVCNCQKPLPGLLFKAADDFSIDLERSWMIGDILNDVEAGNRAGCKTILINNGNETEWITTKLRKPHGIAATINEAASIILQHELARME